MIISNAGLELICNTISNLLKIDTIGLHVAAIFEDNNHHEVIGWAILDIDNNIVKRYNELMDIFKDYGYSG